MVLCVVLLLLAGTSRLRAGRGRRRPVSRRGRPVLRPLGLRLLPEEELQVRGGLLGGLLLGLEAHVLELPLHVVRRPDQIEDLGRLRLGRLGLRVDRLPLGLPPGPVPLPLPRPPHPVRRLGLPQRDLARPRPRLPDRPDRPGLLSHAAHLRLRVRLRLLRHRARGRERAVLRPRPAAVGAGGGEPGGAEAVVEGLHEQQAARHGHHHAPHQPGLRRGASRPRRPADPAAPAGQRPPGHPGPPRPPWPGPPVEV